MKTVLKKKRGVVKSTKIKGVNNMKKLFVVMIAVAMALSFVPRLKADDSATLGLSVTFDLGYLDEIREFAEALARDPLDPNGDSRIGLKDLTMVEAGYLLVLEHVDELPDDVVGILDRDLNGVVDDQDLTIVYNNIMGAIADIDAIHAFADVLAGTSVDFNGDGAVDTKDVERVKWAYARAFELLRYLDQGVIDILDQNRDGVVDTYDADIVANRVLAIIDVIAFAKVLGSGSLNFNGDDLVDHIDAEVTRDMYEFAFQFLGYLDDETRFALDCNKDGVVDIDDRLDVEERIEMVIVVRDFTQLLNQGILDFNEDGEVTEEDILVANDRYEMAYREMMNLDDEMKRILDQNHDAEINDMDLEIVIEKILNAIPRLSIELYPLDWLIQGIKLGGLRSNLDELGLPIHYIANTGNVDVMVDIGYGPQTVVYPAIVPGLEQGRDTFITALGQTVDGMFNIIPPDKRLKVDVIRPRDKIALGLTYGAPTAVSEGIQSHKATYELRAYPIILEE